MTHRRRQRFLLAACAILLPAIAFAQQEPAKQATLQPGPFTLSSDAAVILHFIRPDKTADFEAIVRVVRDQLSNSGDESRERQAAGWRIFKAAEAGPGGATVYVSIIDPVVKDADYSMGSIVAEMSGLDSHISLSTYLDAFATPAINLLHLTALKD